MDTLNTTIQTHFGLGTTKGMFGIEIETEGVFPEVIRAKGWDIKQDGSLRNGLEFVSTPVDDVRGAVTVLNTSLATARVALNPSYRCSTHIHFNFQRKTFKDLSALMIAWAALEPLFLRRMPANRDGSIYCMSSYDTGDLPFYFERFCDDLRNSFRKFGFRGRNKYASLNILRLQDLGTVEFRIFPTSVDPEEIDMWSDWIRNLSTFTEKYAASEMLQMVRYIEKNPMTVAGNIFNGNVPFSQNECSEFVDLGCKTAYEMARVFNRALAKGSAKKAEKKIPQIGGLEVDGWADNEEVEF